MKIYVTFLILVGIHLLIMSNIQFTAWPEMFSYPYLFNNNFLLYKDIALPYQPLLVFILALVYKLFGYSFLVNITFTNFVILLNDLILFLISLKIIGRKTEAVLPILIYIFLQPLFEGNGLWFDLASTPFVLLGFLMLIWNENSRRNFFLAGLFWTMAFFIKQQQALIFLAFGVFVIYKRKFFGLKEFTLGIFLPAALIVGYVIYNSIISDFVFWTFEVPLIWYPKTEGYINYPSKYDLLACFLIFAPVFFYLLLNFKKIKDIEILTLGLFATTFLIAFPRFAFFRLQPALAVFIILLSFVIARTKKVSLVVFLSILLSIVILIKIHPPAQRNIRFYSESEVRFAQFIKENTEPQEKVFLLGPHSLEYVLSDRLPPKPWIDNYNWYMEIPGMQKKIIDGFEKAPPKFIYRSAPYNGAWYELGTYQPKEVLNYMNNKYTLSGSFQGIQIWTRKD